MLRVLAGLPNLEKRLGYVESRVWNAAGKAGYLATIPDPDQALQQTLDPHIVAILKRVPMLQDYQLLAAPLPGESAAAGQYGGIVLGTPPTLRLTASANGLNVTLGVTLDDPTGSQGPARPLSVDWGDGRVRVTSYRPANRPWNWPHLCGHEPLCDLRRRGEQQRAARRGVRGGGDAAGAGCIASGHGCAAVHADRAGLQGLSMRIYPSPADLRLALYLERHRWAALPRRAQPHRERPDQYHRAGRARRRLCAQHIPPGDSITGDRAAPRTSRLPRPAGAIPTLKLSTLLLGVFSTALMDIVDRTWH